MKIMINYDLLTRVVEANKGFSLNKYSKKILVTTGIIGIFNTCLAMLLRETINDAIQPTLRFLIFYSLIDIISQSITSNLNKQIAILDLIELSRLLKSIDVNTNYELLLDSYLYKTEYEIDFSNFKLYQKKYIMVPVNDLVEEVSLVQEHVVGTNKYSLSHGKPNKVLKLVHNPA